MLVCSKALCHSLLVLGLANESLMHLLLGCRGCRMEHVSLVWTKSSGTPILHTTSGTSPINPRNARLDLVLEACSRIRGGLLAENLVTLHLLGSPSDHLIGVVLTASLLYHNSTHLLRSVRAITCVTNEVLRGLHHLGVRMALLNAVLHRLKL